MKSSLTYTSSAVDAPLTGRVRIPGDKSISHRVVMFASLAKGTSKITGLLEGEDVHATVTAFRTMGVDIHGPKDGNLTIKGLGMRGLQRPEGELDMGNSGTAMRLMTGILAAQNFATKLIGDNSLNNRPMRRITVPLTAMGARCVTDEDGCPPIHIRGVDRLEPVDYKLPVASAQVKSAILLAGLYAEGETSVTELAPTRDHTERMLQAFGYVCTVKRVNDLAKVVSVEGGGELTAANIDVPGDISSAAFFMVAASIVEGSSITLKYVGINPTRTGVVEILRSMGANIKYLRKREIGGEPVADIKITASPLTGVDIPPELIPLAIDEIPIVCIAAACAKGSTRISGAEELRHKESDRISAMVNGLRAIGIEVRENRDGLEIEGGVFKGGIVNSVDDHRIAMAFSIAGMVAQEPIVVQNCQNVATSFPNFIELASTLGLQIREDH